MAIHLLVIAIAGFTAARCLSCPISMSVWSVIIALSSNVVGMQLYLLVQPPWFIDPGYVAVNALIGGVGALVAAPAAAFVFRRLIWPQGDTSD